MSSRADNPPFSVTIQTVIYRNDPALLVRSVEGAGRALGPAREAGLEGPVVVAHGDASEEPLSEAWLQRIEEGAQRAGLEYRYTFFGENTGSAKGQNRLAALCPAAWHFIINPDVIIGGGCLAELARRAADERVGVLEARVLPIEELKAFDPLTLETSWSTGACTFVRGSSWRRVGGYDEENFFLYCDDVDLSWRIRLGGEVVLHVPEARVYHDKRIATTGVVVVSETEFFYSALASQLMAHKWGEAHDIERAAQNISGERYAEVRAELERLRAAGRLPRPVPERARVAHFNPNGGYGPSRAT